MSNMNTVFRRLSEQDVDRFKPWYTIPSIKIVGIVILLTVCLRWITT
jgi:hypothetical protein